MEKEGREVEGECMGMKGRGREKLMEGWQIMKELLSLKPDSFSQIIFPIVIHHKKNVIKFFRPPRKISLKHMIKEYPLSK